WRARPTSPPPGRHRRIDATTKTALPRLPRSPPPAEIRRAGRQRIPTYLRRVGGLPTAGVAALVDRALAAAAGQRVTIPGEAVAADIVRELAHDALSTRARRSELDKQI